MTAVLERDRRDKRPALLWAWRLLRLDFTGIAFAALFFCLSLTPSLLPRDWLFAGLIGGINAAIGYGIGVFVVKMFRRFLVAGRGWRRPPPRWCSHQNHELWCTQQVFGIGSMNKIQILQYTTLQSYAKLA